MAALLHLAARRCALIVSDDDDNTVKRIPTSHNETDSNRIQILVWRM
ncbi:hypothetical protein [Bacteroides uniformis]